MKHKKKSHLAAAEFLAVLIVTAVVFTKGLSAALAWRGYKAVGGDIIAVNEIFVDMFKECCIGEPWCGAGRWNTPIVQKNDDFMLVMFPMKINPEFFEIWKEA